MRCGIVDDNLLDRGYRISQSLLSRFQDDPVLHERDLAHLAPYPFFLAEKVPEEDLSPLGTDQVHRFQDQLFPVIVPYIGFKIAHGCLHVRSHEFPILYTMPRPASQGIWNSGLSGGAARTTSYRKRS